MVAAAPSGTTFCIRAGTYNVGPSGIQMKSGDKLIGAGRESVFIKGSGWQIIDASKAPGAVFRSIDVSGATGNRDCRPRCGRGIVPGANNQIIDVRVHHNFTAGIGGGAAGLLILDSELDHNGSEAMTGCCAGGVKSANSFTIRNSYVHDNIGNGIWLDMCGDRLVATNNVVKNNTKDGIRYEQPRWSCPDSRSASILYNTVQNNNLDREPASAGINVNSSPNAVVASNTLGSNGLGHGIRVGGTRGPLTGTEIRNNSLNRDKINGCDLATVSCVSNG